uniref:Uncharacterized protein n=1 Tax=Cannabis sativa TaxID=3483 RepID=A0A803PZ26_CANSA
MGVSKKMILPPITEMSEGEREAVSGIEEEQQIAPESSITDAPSPTKPSTDRVPTPKAPSLSKFSTHPTVHLGISTNSLKPTAPLNHLSKVYVHGHISVSSMPNPPTKNKELLHFFLGKKKHTTKKQPLSCPDLLNPTSSEFL